MKINFRSKGIFYGDVARDYVVYRLGFALGRFADVVDQIDVYVEDTNGERGGLDKRCRIKVFLAKTGAPIINSVNDKSVSAAIDLACHRIRGTVARAADRMSDHRPYRKRAVGNSLNGRNARA
jgi:putative sigma-54 modulation protein